MGLADDVSFTGFVVQPHTILPAFDIFAISSDTEQMPPGVMEAMAAGLPVASLDVGDVRQMVAQENRAYVTGRGASDLVGSLTLLLGDSAARATPGVATKGWQNVNLMLPKCLRPGRNCSYTDEFSFVMQFFCGEDLSSCLQLFDNMAVFRTGQV